ncbi:MAG TPA: sugar ABC transporter ATP-binding protein [Hyphomicrobiales bacterium]|nr:sugar ABC transporter ATP-binding protein [Hyphomicrobiales bacterium]
MSASPILVCEDISKSFPGVRALRDVSLKLFPRRIVGLVGENGAGKSTLLRILAGVYQPDGGRVLWNGVPMSFAGPSAAFELGIATVHQDINLIGSLSVAENIFLNNEPARAGVISTRGLKQATQRMLERYSIPVEPNELVEHLPNDMQKMVQILKALTWSPKVLLLDEPTSSLTQVEVKVVLKLIKSMAADGVSIVFVSHYLNEVFEICDDIVVLRDGAVALSAESDDTSLDQVVGAMLGQAIHQHTAHRRHVAEGPSLFSVKGLNAKGIRDISFELRSGEVLGVTGLTGSGTTELARALFGVGAPKGDFEIEGRPARIDSPSSAIRLGIGFVSSDRRGEGLLPAASVYENISLPSLARLAGPWGYIRESDMMAAGHRAVARLRIKCSSPAMPVGLLSGGNQQKTVFAKWLETSPRILVLSEPTLGVDVGSKAEIRSIIESLCEEGVGVILITTELADIEQLCDRALVMFRGETVAEISGGDLQAEAILRAATSGRMSH